MPARAISDISGIDLDYRIVGSEAGAEKFRRILLWMIHRNLKKPIVALLGSGEVMHDRHPHLSAIRDQILELKRRSSTFVSDELLALLD